MLYNYFHTLSDLTCYYFVEDFYARFFLLIMSFSDFGMTHSLTSEEELRAGHSVLSQEGL
jgi:hypothetical protein